MDWPRSNSRSKNRCKRTKKAVKKAETKTHKYSHKHKNAKPKDSTRGLSDRKEEDSKPPNRMALNGMKNSSEKGDIVHRKSSVPSSTGSTISNCVKALNITSKRKTAPSNLKQTSQIKTKIRKTMKPFEVESNSDAEDYIDQYFMDDENDESKLTLPTDSSEYDSDLESSTSGSKDYEYIDSEEEGDEMSFAELLDYFGNNRDKDQKARKKSELSKDNNKIKSRDKPKANPVAQSIPGKKRSNFSNCWVEIDKDVNYGDKSEKATKVDRDVNLRPLKPAASMPGKRRIKSSSSTNFWLEEDNDAALVNGKSDRGKDSNKLNKALVPASVDISDDEEYYPGKELDENETLPSDSEEDSFGSEDTFDSEYTDDDTDEYDSSFYNEFSSEYDDEDELDEEEEYNSYWDDSYDSEEDTDYNPSEDDYLFIGRGEAKIYEIDDNNVSFNSDIDTAQIVELPNEEARKPSTSIFANERQTDDEKDVCPVLVPIYDENGELIDNPDKLLMINTSHKSLPKISSPQRSAANEPNFEPKSTQPLEQDTELSACNLNDLAILAGVDNELTVSDTALDTSNFVVDKSKYRMYDSIDMRMSLLILQEPLYVLGILTLQPLLGSLEIMGCRLKRDECRNVYATKGFNYLNLTPCFEKTGYPKDVMVRVLTRLEKHFQDADLRELEEGFDPTNSVLVLLQANCNNKKVTIVEKYMSEEMLFPKPEYLKSSPFLTTEYLLNVEFTTEAVGRNTPLFQRDPIWDTIELEANSKLLVMGGKRSGKSTLCQYLINKNISKFRKVVLIDLDIGQPLHHIPETISLTVITRPLLGVGTFDIIRPTKCLLFGSLDVMASPVFYLENVIKLLQFCEDHLSELENVPWIINTMGYVTGFGEELMAAVLRLFMPTTVVQLVAESKSLGIPNFQYAMTADVVNEYKFNILQNEMELFAHKKASYSLHQFYVNYPAKGFKLSAPKRRTLMLLAHLANILDDSSSEWFNEVKPFRAPLSKFQMLVTNGDHTLKTEQLPKLLNASLVYLCRKTSEKYYDCLGVGIVRGVDKSDNVYLLQSLSEEELATVNVLAVCSSSLPNSVLLKQSVRVQGSLPYVYNVG